jgi:hypothetical protein
VELGVGIRGFIPECKTVEGVVFMVYYLILITIFNFFADNVFEIQ